MPQSLIGRQALQSTVRALEIVEALPFLELGVEELGVVDHHAGEHAVEVLVVDAMRPLHLPVEAWCRRTDVDMANTPVQDVHMKAGLEFGAVVGLD